MNKQDGSKPIEWTDYTWNPIAGCQHDCAWEMPDGAAANCYAEDIADGAAKSAYPKGFRAHYWKPNKLHEPFSVKEPARIFVGSMTDLFGHWVPDEQIEQVLDVCRKAHWHNFQVLTKNAPRLARFNFPANVWVGVSVPPTWIFGKLLSNQQQYRMIQRQFETLAKLSVPVRWMSIEPLSWDIAAHMKDAPLEWAVIGAASNHRRVYQPKPEWVTHALEVLDKIGAAVFFKGNLRGNAAAQVWREEFPTVERLTQQSMF